MDSADRKEIEELVNSIIKSGWEDGLNVSIDTGNGTLQPVQVKKLLQSFYKSIKDLSRQLQDLKNSVAEHSLNNIISDRINTWWKSEASVYMPKERKSYPKEVVFNALLDNVRRNKDKTEALEQNQGRSMTKIEIQYLVSQSIENFAQKMQYNYYLQNHENRLKELTDENKKLKEEIAILNSQMNTQQTQKSFDSSNTQKINTWQSADSSSPDQIVAIFNRWAKNPMASLPSQFRYAEGDLKIREKQDIKHSYDDNALWIVNTSGSTKYLFPNPNSIDQIGGDIDVLYSVTGTRRARGQNKVDIQKACVIVEDGWIEYKGALSLS